MISLKSKISTTFLKKTAQFYQELFGMVEVEAWDDPDDKGIILAFGRPPYRALLEVYQSEASNGAGGVSLQIRVPDVDAFVKTLPARVAFDGPSVRPWGPDTSFSRIHPVSLVWFPTGRPSEESLLLNVCEGPNSSLSTSNSDTPAHKGVLSICLPV